MEKSKMITAVFTQEEVQCLIQSLEAERDQYLKDDGSNRLRFVREIAGRMVEQNNQLIQNLKPCLLKLEEIHYSNYLKSRLYYSNLFTR